MRETPCLSSDDLTSVISRCRSVLWLLASTKVEGRLYVSYLVPALPIQWVQMILNEHVRKWMKMAIYRTSEQCHLLQNPPLQYYKRSSGSTLPYTQGIVWQFLCTFCATWLATTRRLLDLLQDAFSCCKVFVFFTGDGHKCRTLPGMFSTFLDCLDLR